MSVNATTLRQLHRIHVQLSDLRERLDRGPRQIQARKNNVARLEAELAAKREETKAAKMSADQKQLQLKTGETKIADLKNKLNACGSNREYQALREQIAADQMANSVLEDEILEALGRIDDLEKEAKEADKKLAAAREDLTKVEQEVRSQVDLLQADVSRLEEELKEAERSLPGDLKMMYERVMRSKGSDGMAAIEGEVCGGCYQMVPPNMFNKVTMGEPIFCPSCGRLIYLPEDRSVGK